MTESDLVPVLQSIPFLQALPEGSLAKLARISRIHDFPAGEIIFRQGDPAEIIYLVIEGTVALEICAPAVGCKRILTVGDGELLGWSPVLEQERLTATARTLTETKAVAISGRQIVSLCASDTEFGYEFMRRAALALATRLNATRMQLVDVYGSQMPVAPDERIGSF